MQGLVDAASSIEKQDLAKHIRRIAFLGTPHQGADKAQWAETGRRFIGLFKASNPELLKDLSASSKDLEDKSEKLANIGVRFPNLLRHRAQSPESQIEVNCFYEGLPMQGLGTV
jgi:protein SERAC1